MGIAKPEIVTSFPEAQSDNSDHEIDAIRSAIAAYILGHTPQTEATFDSLALGLFSLHMRLNAAYRAYVTSLPAPASRPQSWRDIPAVPQDGFKHARLSIYPKGRATRIFTTSGTTSATRGQHEFASTQLYDLAILEGWKHARLPSMTRICLLPPPDKAPDWSLSHMVGVVAAGLSGAHEAYGRDRSTADFDAVLARLEQQREPLMLMTTAVTLWMLMERIVSSGNTPNSILPAGSWIWETGGYKGARITLSKRAFYRRIAETFGVPDASIVNEYGMTELSSQCYGRGADGEHYPPPWLRVRVINPETGTDAQPGTMGFARLHDLANVESVFAIDTQDLCVAQESGGFQLIGRNPSAPARGCSLSANEHVTPHSAGDAVP